jgi:hypothetical protein
LHRVQPLVARNCLQLPLKQGLPFSTWLNSEPGQRVKCCEDVQNQPPRRRQLRIGVLGVPTCSNHRDSELTPLGLLAWCLQESVAASNLATGSRRNGIASPPPCLRNEAAIARCTWCVPAVSGMIPWTMLAGGFKQNRHTWAASLNQSVVD